MTQSNFFDAIGVADMEKVHSAVIGWMLSDKCEAFDRATRSKLLQQIFGIKEAFEEFSNIDSFIEWKNIDILIVTTKGSEKKCWVIENKIKSSQHSDQLNRYVDTINDEKEFQFNKKAFCFLTLVVEAPRCSKPVTWINTKYEDLVKYIEKEKLISNKDGIILSEYLDCIRNLSNAFSDFKNHHVDYENVFNDGELKKVDKLKKWDNPATVRPKGNHFRYISDNGLETIFQKCFLSIIIPQNIKKADGFIIKETRGTALVEYRYATTEKALFGFQFQNGTFKIQVSRPNPEKRDDIAEQEFQTKWKGFLEDYCNRGWRFNHQQKNNPPYYSLSKSWDSLDSDLSEVRALPWYYNTVEKIKEQWMRVHNDCAQVLEKMLCYSKMNIPH